MHALKAWGAIYGSQIYHLKTSSFLEGQNIAIHEIYNILIALRTWARQWENKSIKFFVTI